MCTLFTDAENKKHSLSLTTGSILKGIQLCLSLLFTKVQKSRTVLKQGALSLSCFKMFNKLELK